MQKCKSFKALFSTRHSLLVGRGGGGGGGGGGVGQGLPKTLSEQPHLASGCFMKLFYKTTTCPKIKCLFVIFSLVYDIFDSIWLTQKIFLAD